MISERRQNRSRSAKTGGHALPNRNGRWRWARIPMNSVQHSGSSRYGIPIQAGTVIHRLVGVG